MSTRRPRAERSGFVHLGSAGLATAALLVATPSSAEAAGASSHPATKPSVDARQRVHTSRGRWYGWQSLAGHLSADAGVVIGLAGIYRIDPQASEVTTVPVLLGVLSHAGVSLAVHGARREWANLGGGLGLSLGLPAGGAIVGLLAAVLSGGLKEDAPAPPHLMIGAAAGLHLAGIIDAAGFSYETVTRPVKDAAPPSGQKAVLAPLFVPAQGGGIVGLAGSW